jgi:hypothetical protein
MSVDIGRSLEKIRNDKANIKTKTPLAIKENP